MVAFSDRFSFNNPVFGAIEANIEAATEEELAAASPALVEMAAMVRRFSILLKQVPLKEIYYTVTDHSDPEIALILAAAKNPDGTFRWANMNVLKEFMFGEPEYDNTIRNIFVEGLRRVSAGLAGAELVSRFATLKEQLDHAEALKKRAIDELDRIIAMPNLDATGTTTKETEELKNRIYFEITDFTVIDELKMEVYIPTSRANPAATTWVTAAIYQPGPLSTAQIVGDLGNYINSYTLSLASTNIIASPVLATDDSTVHYIEFILREYIPNIIGEVVCIRFTYTNTPIDYVPFKWGTLLTNLQEFVLNSVLIVALGSKIAALSAAEQQQQEVIPSVLYIKRIVGVTPEDTGNIKLRLYTPPELSPNGERIAEIVDIPITRTIDVDPVVQEYLDDKRADEVAVLIVNKLAEYKLKTRILGAILRNDPIVTGAEEIAIVDIFCWSVTNPEIATSMDVLEVPNDIEITLGDKQRIYSAFSRFPRSLVVSTQYTRFFNQQVNVGSELAATQGNTPKLIKYGRSRLLDRINDESTAATGYIIGNRS